ncbi:hypothetical protein [Hymenobacter fodinae]|uniref:Uncharacterized protein n=1 Tax=Hymenobacter fodinae TaxID=2510796 RepID=A0A4Z0P0I1_9BACT|nr:hypothetical protein [Hymenobacter fodinae]TGE04656.1 hypothetical protein EU556_20945 [Hymenobacter fodinae]
MTVHIQFEAKKHALRQTQDGSVTISLNIHPDDVDPRLLMAPMGKVFQVVMVDPDDIAEAQDEAPEAADTLTQQAAIMCQGVRWMEFVNAKYRGHNFKDGADAMRQLCGVASRRDIKEGTKAGDTFKQLNRDLDAFLQHDVI